MDALPEIASTAPRACGSVAARDAYLRGLPDCVRDTDGAGDEDGRVLELAKLVAAKDMRVFPALERALRLTSAHPRATSSEPARLHAAAAAAWLAHKPLLAGHLYSTLSAKRPHDSKKSSLHI